MAHDHDDHHGHPHPPDTRKLWVDEGWGAIAGDTAKMWFAVTMICVVLYGAAVIFWIFL
ncbi:MAG: hypothetical protein H6719_35135 [Sandaracinaceae bacterium]|nr:hypothetical protein [Sandaracinaceae bacterium]